MGAIVGGAVGGIAALALLGLLLYCLRKKRKERMGEGGGTSSGGSDYFDKSNLNTPRSDARFGVGVALPLSPRSNSESKTKSKSGLGSGSDADHIYPLPYQGGHASRGIPSAQAYPHSPDFGASPGRNGRMDAGVASPTFNRAALGTSINPLGSENHSDPQKMRQRGFEPPSEVSSTTWAGSPNPASARSELLSPGMQLLHHPRHHQDPWTGANGDSTGPAYLPLSALPHHSPFTPFQSSPMLHSAGGVGQGQAGYSSLGTPVSPPRQFRGREAGSWNDRSYTGFPLAGTAEHLAHAYAYPPIERDRKAHHRRYRPRDAEDELSPQDSCSNIGGPTHGHVPGDSYAPTQTIYETGHERSASPDAQRHEHGHGHEHGIGFHAPPGYVESVSSGGGGGGAAGSAAAARAAAASARKT